MATDEEIREEAEKESYCLDTQSNKKRIIDAIKRCVEFGRKEGKKEGIRMERQRLRKQVGNDADEWSKIKINDIDIWDD